jgi:hypothetical protein
MPRRVLDTILMILGLSLIVGLFALLYLVLAFGG